MPKKKRCTGIAKSTRVQCRRPAAEGSVYCRQHQHLDASNAEEDYLLPEERLFVDNYFAHGFNAAAAMKATRPHLKDTSATTQGGLWLRERPNIQRAVYERMEIESMTAAETLARLTNIARGDIGDFMDEEGQFDLMRPEARKKLSLLRKIKRDQYGRISEIELHDSKDALKVFTKVHSLVSDRVEHTGGVTVTHKKAYDYTVLSEEEFNTLQALVEKLEGTVAIKKEMD